MLNQADVALGHGMLPFLLERTSLPASLAILSKMSEMCRVHLLEHLVDVEGVGLAPFLLALPALGALTLKLLDLLFVRVGGHAAAEGLLPA
jgi:hypothetical protein